MINIHNNNKFPKKCNKKQVEKLESLIISNDDVDQQSEKLYRKDMLDIDFV